MQKEALPSPFLPVYQFSYPVHRAFSVLLYPLASDQLYQNWICFSKQIFVNKSLIEHSFASKNYKNSSHSFLQVHRE